MTDAIAVINQLSRSGIQVRLQDGKLLTRAAQGAITAEIAALIASSKRTLIEFLRARQAAGALQLPPIERASEAARKQLSHTQQRLWLIDRMAGSSASYNMPAAIMIDGPLNRDALARAANALVRRHEILRTVFVERDGAPECVLLPEAEIRIEEIDLSSPAGDVDPHDLQRRISLESGRPFNLAAEPGLRLTLFGLSAVRNALLVNMHHIASDGWSVGVFVRELVHLYEVFVEGRADDLPPLRIQYGDYAAWQRSWPGELIERQKEYWQRRLAEAPQLHGLPADYPRPAASQNRGAVCSRKIGADIGKPLITLCQQEGATLFMALQLVFAILLARWSNENDIVVGTPIAGRVRPELEDLIGLFVNTLVLRTRIDSERTFRELLLAAIRDAVEAYDNQLVPFDALVDALRPERTAGHSPLVQILFAMQNTERVGVRLGGLSLSTIDLQFTSAKMDLTLNVAENDGELFASWEFDTELFASRTIERMAEHYERVLVACVAQPDVKIAELDMLGTGERARLVHELNDNRRPYPQMGVAEVFDEVAQRCGAEIALIDGAVRMSYAMVKERVDVLAEVLRGRGMSREEPVGIFLDRGADMVISMLGIMKAGGAYVPLDVSQPLERLTLIVADSAMRLIISSRQMSTKLAAMGRDVLLVDEPETSAVPSRGAPQIDEPQSAPRSAADSLAYIMYTSGSTGAPKGVMIEQRGILRLVLNTDYMAIGPGDTVAQASNSAFDASTFEIWAALLNSACLAFVDPDTLLAPERLERRLAELAVTTLWMTTSLFSQTVRLRPAMFSGLKYLFFGGEAAEPQSIERVLAAGKPQHLINIYGPTENTSFTTWFEVSSASPEGYPIGRPIANTSCYVLGKGRELLPFGAVGELYVGGDGVARGYLNRAELNTERFSQNPFGPGRLYATGDIVRWRADDNLQFLGRADDQLKIRGFRIEPGEIEQSFLSLEEVEATAVIVLDDATRGKSLAAYVTLKAAVPPEHRDPRLLRARLAARLPAYMIPDAIVVLSELPLNANGKLDRQRLPAPALFESVVAADDEPRGAMELALAGLWREVLQLDAVRSSASFFEIGGNSLLLMKLSSRIKETFGAEITVSEFYDRPTVREQARLLNERRESRAFRKRAESAAGDFLQEEYERIGLTDGGAVIPKQPPADDYPLSFAQQRLWFESLLGGGTSYTVPVALEFEGELDERALSAALHDIVSAHDVLRSRYFSREGVGRQSIAPPSQWSLQHVDLCGNPDPQETCAAHMKQTIEEPFDLAVGPVFNAILYKLGPALYRLLLKMHHIVADGWSLQILTERISSLYMAYTSGNPLVQVSSPFIQYTDYAVWQRQSETDEAAESSLRECAERLAFVRDMPLLPVDTERYLDSSYPLGTRSLRIEAAAAAQMRRTALDNKASLFVVALSLFALVIGRYSRQRRIAVGTDFAGRSLKQTEELVGLFVNQLAIVAELDVRMTFAEYVASIRESTLFALQHERVPVERLVSELGLQRRMTQHPLFQTKLVLQNFVMGTPASLPGLRVRRVPLESKNTKIDLMLTLIESGDGIDGDWEFNAAYFKDSTIALIHREFMDLIELLKEPSMLTLEGMQAHLDRMQSERLAQLRQATKLQLGRRTPSKALSG